MFSPTQARYASQRALQLSGPVPQWVCSHILPDVKNLIHLLHINLSLGKCLVEK